MILDPNVALKISPCEDGLDAVRETLGNMHRNAVWLATLTGEEHAVAPIFTTEGDEVAPKLEP
jgi:hypothetical protein